MKWGYMSKRSGLGLLKKDVGLQKKYPKKSSIQMRVVLLGNTEILMGNGTMSQAVLLARRLMWMIAIMILLASMR